MSTLRGMRFRALAGIVGAGALMLGSAGSTLAQERALNPVITVNGGYISLTGGPLPKGLFNTANTLNSGKSLIEVQWSVDASACLPADSGEATSSNDDGWFDPVKNTKGTVVAWNWQTVLDLSAQQNHWHHHVHCEETLVRGCPEARNVTLSVTLYTPGGEVWSSATVTASLPSVQDDTVVDQGQCGGGSCAGMGDCINACHADCGSPSDCPPGPSGAECRDGVQACRTACPCNCQAELGCGHCQ